jgi:hypothetical protein
VQSPPQPAPRAASPPNAPAAPDAAAPTGAAAGRRPQRQPLAKLQLVKRHSPEEERKQLLRRLLTQF